MIRHTRWVALIVFALAARAPAQDSAEFADWLKLVPGGDDARFYVELRDLVRIRSIFQHLGIWDTVRELSAPGAANATAQPWPLQAERSLGMAEDEAVAEILGHRAALIAGSAADWKSGVILAELRTPSQVKSLLRRGRARTLSPEGAVQRYQLDGNIQLAVRGRTVLFGQASDPSGLWGRTVLLMAGRSGPTLAGRSDVAALRAQLTSEYNDPSCLMYAAWPVGDGAGEAGTQRLLIAARVTPSEIRCEVRGRFPGQRSDRPGLGPDTLTALPATTLACWARSCDAREIQSVLGPAGPADHESLIGVFLSVLVSDEQERRQLTEDIGPRVVFVVGQGKRSGDSGMALPSMGLLVESKGGQRLVEHLDRAVDLFTAFLAAVSGSTTRPDGETYIVRREVEGVELHYAPIGPMLTRRLKAPILASLEPCWAIVGDRMCMSTSSAHIAEIVRALRGSGSRLEVSGEMARPEAGATEWIYIQGKALSQVGTNLLRHLETTQPAMLRATWWQAWAEARLAKRERLGLSIKPESRTQRTARVEHVDVDSPAQGLLTAGDVIVAVGGRSLATAEPAREVAEAYARRKAGESFVLTVRRGADTLDVQIPTRAPIDVDLRDFDPIAALRRLTLLLSRVETLTISGRSTRSDRLDSQIVIRWDPSLSKPAPPGPPSDQ